MALNETIQAVMPEGYMVTKVAMCTEVYDSRTGESKLVTSYSQTTSMWDAVGMLELAAADVKRKYTSLGDRALGHEDDEDGEYGYS